MPMENVAVEVPVGTVTVAGTVTPDEALRLTTVVESARP